MADEEPKMLVDYILFVIAPSLLLWYPVHLTLNQFWMSARHLLPALKQVHVITQMFITPSSRNMQSKQSSSTRYVSGSSSKSCKRTMAQSTPLARSMTTMAVPR